VRGWLQGCQASVVSRLCMLTSWSLRPKHRYKATFHKQATDTSPNRKEGGGYWIPAKDNYKGESVPFLASTTYR
jgi:hypothetical protein